MKTDQLIDALAADSATPPARLTPAFRAASLVAALAAAILFAAMLGPRHDFVAALGTLRFPFKFVVTLTLAAAAGLLALRLARPGADPSIGWRALLLAPVLLAIGVAGELLMTPSGYWGARLVGRNWLICLVNVPLLSVLPLAAILFALRRGAPSSPAGSGAAAGLLAGAIGATFYAAHCTDDSPLFVAVWYSLGIGVAALAGALIGGRMLRW